MTMTTTTTMTVKTIVSSLQQDEKTKETTKTKRNCTTAVRFHNSVEVHLTLHVDDYSDQEFEACWYTPAEYGSIRKELLMTFHLMKLRPNFFADADNNTDSSSTDFNNRNNTMESSSLSLCVRGLESLHTDEKGKGCFKRTTKIRRQESILAVLDEQYLQCEKAIQQHLQRGKRLLQEEEKPEQKEKNHNFFFFVYDDVKIRDAYRKYTRISEDIAYSRGQIDASSVIDTDDVVDDGRDCKSNTISKKQDAENNNSNITTSTTTCCCNDDDREEKRWSFHTNTMIERHVQQHKFPAVA